MEHVRKDCMVKGCDQEASYWLDVREGFIEPLIDFLAPETFYLCIDHQAEIKNDNTGNYHHLRIDTGEVAEIVIGGYSCSDECEVCADS